MPTRRTFHKAAAATVASLSASSYARAIGANERVRLGFIGVGNRGDQLLDAFLAHKDCEINGVCDLYEPYVFAAVKKVGKTLHTPTDYRKLLEVAHDAVVIATP